MLGRVAPESVIYSFGTLLLDLLSGKHIPPSHLNSVNQARTTCALRSIDLTVSKQQQPLLSKQQVVDTVLKMFNAEKQKKGRKMPRWSVIKVPKQSDGFQCGYYVMKYLSEIIESDGLETITSLQSLFNKNSYSTVEIDQVGTEWTDCVQDYMYACRLKFMNIVDELIVRTSVVF